MIEQELTELNAQLRPLLARKEQLERELIRAAQVQTYPPIPTSACEFVDTGNASAFFDYEDLG